MTQPTKQELEAAKDFIINYGLNVNCELPSMQVARVELTIRDALQAQLDIAREDYDEKNLVKVKIELSKEEPHLYRLETIAFGGKKYPEGSIVINPTQIFVPYKESKE